MSKEKLTTPTLWYNDKQIASLCGAWVNEPKEPGELRYAMQYDPENDFISTDTEFRSLSLKEAMESKLSDALSPSKTKEVKKIMIPMRIGHDAATSHWVSLGVIIRGNRAQVAFMDSLEPGSVDTEILTQVQDVLTGKGVNVEQAQSYQHAWAQVDWRGVKEEGPAACGAYCIANASRFLAESPAAGNIPNPGSLTLREEQWERMNDAAKQELKIEAARSSLDKQVDDESKNLSETLKKLSSDSHYKQFVESKFKDTQLFESDETAIQAATVSSLVGRLPRKSLNIVFVNTGIDPIPRTAADPWQPFASLGRQQQIQGDSKIASQFQEEERAHHTQRSKQEQLDKQLAETVGNLQTELQRLENLQREYETSAQSL